MFDRILHHPLARALAGIIGTFFMAVGVNLFVVPQGLYSGGLLGFCQLLRTLLTDMLGVNPGFDISGALYLLLNIPLFLLAWRNLGRNFVVRTIICTASSSVFLSLIPVPAVPIVADPLTSCLIAGIVGGFACGLVLTCGCSSGGMDIVGLYLSKKGKGFTVGRFSLGFNAVLYLACLLLFDASTAIYSAIYTVFSSLFLDRAHQQNIAVEVTIFTKDKSGELPGYLCEKLSRGVTFWDGRGAYTGDDVQVLCVCLSKFEVEALQRAVREKDPSAFFIVREGVRIGGNFIRHLS